MNSGVAFPWTDEVKKAAEYEPILPMRAPRSPRVSRWRKIARTENSKSVHDQEKFPDIPAERETSDVLACQQEEKLKLPILDPQWTKHCSLFEFENKDKKQAFAETVQQFLKTNYWTAGTLVGSTFVGAAKVTGESKQFTFVCPFALGDLEILMARIVQATEYRKSRDKFPLTFVDLVETALSQTVCSMHPANRVHERYLLARLFVVVACHVWSREKVASVLFERAKSRTFFCGQLGRLSRELWHLGELLVSTKTNSEVNFLSPLSASKPSTKKRRWRFPGKCSENFMGGVCFHHSVCSICNPFGPWSGS